MKTWFVIICLVGYIAFLVKMCQWSDNTMECDDKTGCAEYQSDPPDNDMTREFFYSAAAYGISIGASP